MRRHSHFPRSQTANARSSTRLASWAIAAFLAPLACAGPPRTHAVWVQIPVDASVAAVADSLAAHGIVDSAAQFERLALIGHRRPDIQAGLYPLRPHMPMGQVLRLLRTGRRSAAKVVVRERMTVAELSLQLERTVGIKADDFVAAARDSGLRARVGARGASVEGYLYPTTYYVSLPATPYDILRQMVDTFETRWNSAWNQRLDSLGASRDELVTLASIIAGEMPQPEDLFHVASVYHNRLARGMRLQADPTVVYALGERRRLTFGDYRVASEYNTYTISGLPPGPIGQPSVACLEAALFPVDSDDLFFVGRRDGHYEFSRTYNEHLRMIAQVRGRRRSTS